jgi:hypothetical protein
VSLFEPISDGAKANSNKEGEKLTEEEEEEEEEASR